MTFLGCLTEVLIGLRETEFNFLTIVLYFLARQVECSYVVFGVDASVTSGRFEATESFDRVFAYASEQVELSEVLVEDDWRSVIDIADRVECPRVLVQPRLLEVLKRLLYVLIHSIPQHVHKSDIVV